MFSTKCEQGLDRSAAALRALFAWDKFIKNSDTVSIKVFLFHALGLSIYDNAQFQAAGDADGAWCQRAEEMITSAVKSETRLCAVRFTPSLFSTEKDRSPGEVRSRRGDKARRGSRVPSFMAACCLSLPCAPSRPAPDVNSLPRLGVFLPQSDSLLGGTVLHCAAL